MLSFPVTIREHFVVGTVIFSLDGVELTVKNAVNLLLQDIVQNNVVVRIGMQIQKRR